MSNNDLNYLIEKYNNFYIENKFNIHPPVWVMDNNDIFNSFNINFRGENSFVWQERLGDNKDIYEKYFNKIKLIDEDNLFEKTLENGNYGCIFYRINNINISRDLLDSITEIYFLKSFFNNLNKLRILEIGGGYGRLCKRFLDCFPNSNYYITDAIPYSSYISKLYLENNKDKVINLFDLEEKIKKSEIDIAINIHCFAECNIDDIEWWIKFIFSKKIKYIFYVPNNPKTTSEYMPTNDGKSILEIFNKYNYNVVYHKNIYDILKINYSYAVPFFILKNYDF